MKRWIRPHELCAACSFRDGYCCVEWSEIACVIRFFLMGTHAIYSPASCRRTRRYAMADSQPPLPIQGHSIGITSRNAEADIEKCFWRKIRTRDIDRIRSTSGNICLVESKVACRWGRYEQERTVYFGASNGISTTDAAND